jgi:uncharacterized C2H2 Zn-finger protein
MQQHRCDQCDAVFQTHLALHGHQQVYHGGGEREVGGQTLRLGTPVTFRCAFCGHGFEGVKDLRDHIEVSHRTERQERAAEVKERALRTGAGARRRGRRRAPAGAAA